MDGKAAIDDAGSCDPCEDGGIFKDLRKLYAAVFGEGEGFKVVGQCDLRIAIDYDFLPAIEDAVFRAFETAMG